MNYDLIHKCRVCSSEALRKIHDFGIVPLADKLTERIDEKVPVAPLNLVWCPHCGHLQIAENVPPSVLFNDRYPYYSSKIPEVALHFKEAYKDIIKHFAPDSNALILEIASNDGVLLRHFKKHTSRILGIEPSSDHTDYCNSIGIPTISEFFCTELAAQLVRKEGKASLLIANNVLAHVPDPYDFMRAVNLVLEDDGHAVIEVPYSLNMLLNGGFDVIFHQHFSYFSLHSLLHLTTTNRLVINSLKTIDTQGGSFRLYIGKSGEQDASVNEALDKERKHQLMDLSTYREFSRSIRRSKKELKDLLIHLKKQGNKIAGYGAPGKAATMLNYFGIDKSILDCLYDISESKHYKYFPNTGLQILPVHLLEENPPDIILILAWNYADSILKSLGHLKSKGVRFMIPYPDPTFV